MLYLYSSTFVYLARIFSVQLERQGMDLNLNQSQSRKDHGEKQHLAARMEAMDKYVLRDVNVLFEWRQFKGVWICRRLRDLEAQNRELLQTVAKREESIHQASVSSNNFLFLIHLFLRNNQRINVSCLDIYFCNYIIIHVVQPANSNIKLHDVALCTLLVGSVFRISSLVLTVATWREVARKLVSCETVGAGGHRVTKSNWNCEREKCCEGECTSPKLIYKALLNTLLSSSLN